MRRLYSALMYVVCPIAFILVLWRGLRNRRYWSGLNERFGFGPSAHASRTLWVHAVSLGEITAAAPLIGALRTRYPALPVTVTTATPTGRERAQALFGGGLDVRYLPYDTPGSMRRLMARIRPTLAIIMETELWPNLFDQCRRRHVPVILASARLSPRSVARYRRLGALFRDVLSSNATVAAQSAEDAARFVSLGAAPGRTLRLGNIKFDVAADAAAAARGLELRSTYWAGRPVWIAGSTHAGEEELVLLAHLALLGELRDALLLLVPRHPQRFEAVAELLARSGRSFERRTGTAKVRPDTQVLLVDTMGELAALYAAADIAFVGGSLVAVGGHNLLEPAGLGVPVITGPYQSNGQEIADLLLRRGAAVQVADAVQLAAAVRLLFADPDRRQRMGSLGREAIEANRGSVARLLELIAPLVEAGSTSGPTP